MSLAKSRRLLVGIAAGAIAATLAVGVAVPANAYIDNCDDPLIMTVSVNYVNGKPVTQVNIINSVTGKPLSTWDRDHVLTPDAAKATDGFFSIPVPKKFRGKTTKVSVQLVDDSPDPAQWMAASASHRAWGTGHQVWLYGTVKKAKSTLRVGIPNYDINNPVHEFQFEVIFKAKVKGKKISEAFLVKPKNTHSFPKNEATSNRLTFLTLR